MKDITFDLNIKCTLTQQDVDDLMVIALEGGINYWCGEAVVVEEVSEKHADILVSEALSRDYTIRLVDLENPNDIWNLTLEKLIEGIKQYMIEYGINSIEDLMDNHDAETADTIIQYALFDELVFC